MSALSAPKRRASIVAVVEKLAVTIINHGQVDCVIHCHNRSDVRAIQNAVRFNSDFEHDAKCNPELVRQSVDAFEQYDLTDTKLYRRLHILLDNCRQ